MEKKANIAIGVSIVSALLSLYLVIFGIINEPVVKGTTNFDTLQLSQDLIVGRDATVGDDVSVTGDLVVDGATTLSGTSTLSGTVTAANLVSTGDLTVGDDTILTDSLQVGGNIWSQTGAVTITDGVVITGTCQIGGNVSSQTGAFTVTDALVVTGAADFASTVQYGTGNLYPLGYANSTARSYGGIAATVTNTTILSTSHGCQNGITVALCMIGTPDVGAGDAYLCQYSVSNFDITFQAIQSDTSSATNTDNIHYWIVGW